MGVATTVGPDGGLRLYVTNITDPSGLFGSNLGNTFMLSEPDPSGVRFRNAAAQYGILDTAWGWGTAFVDMDLDGAPDLYAVQGMRAFVGDDSAHLADATSTLFLSDAAGTSFSVAKDTGCDVPGDQRALVVFDYDRDGSPDLLITQVAGACGPAPEPHEREALADGRPGGSGGRRCQRPCHRDGRRPDDLADPARGRQLPRRTSARGLLRARRGAGGRYRPCRMGERDNRRNCATSRLTRSFGCRLPDQPLGGRTATLSQRPPVARRMTNIFANGEVVRDSRAPDLS